jgi:hypothetical protein
MALNARWMTRWLSRSSCSISHDTVWSAHGATTLDGRPAARRTLLKLRPAHTPATSWRGNIDKTLDAIGFAA